MDTELRWPIIDLLYLSTSFLWRQAVAGILGVTSSTALRMNSRCPWQHREGLAKSSAVRSARCPRAGASLQTATADPRGVALLRHPLAGQGHPGGAHGRSNDAIALPLHVMRCLPVSPLFAS